MLNKLKNIFKLFRVKSEQEKIEDYLAESTSLVDLERRQKDLRLRGYPF